MDCSLQQAVMAVASGCGRNIGPSNLCHRAKPGWHLNNCVAHCSYTRSIPATHIRSPPRCSVQPRMHYSCKLHQQGTSSRGRKCIVSCTKPNGIGSNLPQNWTQVMGWARERFRAGVNPNRPDDQILLSQLCLLIALEEEAAVETHPEMKKVLYSQTDLPVRSTSSASTWSLTRLDALAMQVKDLLTRTDTDTAFRTDLLTEAHSSLSSSTGPEDVTNTHNTATGSFSDRLIQEASTGMEWEDDTGMVNSNQQGDSYANTMSDIHTNEQSAVLPAGMFQQQPLRVLDAINTVLFDWHGHQPCERYGDPRDSQLSSVLERGLGSSPSLSILYMQVAERLGVRLAARPLEQGRYWLLWPVDHPDLLVLPHDNSQPDTTQPQPASTLTDNDNVDGDLNNDTDASQGPQQVEPAQGKDAEDAVEQPQSTGNNTTQASKRRLLIDVYGKGCLLTEEEVCELFELQPSQLWIPATKRQMLACLLADLRDAYWSRAVGCSPMPSVMVPLSLQAALDNRVAGSFNEHAIGRALAAAEKITWLLPDDSRAQLDFALLNYFARRWDDAWLELGLILERQAGPYQQGQQINQSQAEKMQADNQGLASVDNDDVQSRAVDEGHLAGDHKLDANNTTSRSDATQQTQTDSNVEPGLDTDSVNTHDGQSQQHIFSTSQANCLESQQTSSLNANHDHSTDNGDIQGQNHMRQENNDPVQPKTGCLTREELDQVALLLEKVRLQLLLVSTV